MNQSTSPVSARFLLHTIPVAAIALTLSACSRQQETPSRPDLPSPPSVNTQAGTQPAPPAQPSPASQVQRPPRIEPGAIVVRVGDHVLTGQQLNQQVNTQLKRLSQQRKNITQEQAAQAVQNLRMRAMDDFVSKALVLMEANAQKITVTDEEVVADIQRYLPEGMTIEQAVQANRMSLEQRKAQSRDKLISLKLVEKAIGATIEPTEEEIKAFYDANLDRFKLPERVRASHILIGFQDGDTEEVRAQKKLKAEAMSKTLSDSPERLSEFARQHSTCPSAKKGGDLGEFGRKDMVKPFADAAFSQKVGEISSVVETKFGYHIIQVTDKKEAGNVPVDKVRRPIILQLVREKQNEHGKIVTAFLQSLKSKYKVEYGTYLKPVDIPNSPNQQG